VLLEELIREACLPDLARQRPLRVADVEVADELLRDRRAALDDVALREVLVEGACDALVVERAVLPEARVLDRHRRLRQPRRDLRERLRLAVGRRRHDAEQAHVVRVEEGVLAERERSEVGQAAGREQHLPPGEGDGREHERDGRGEEERQEEEDAAALAVAAAQPRMAREEQPFEVPVRARPLPPLRPSSVTTLITCHCCRHCASYGKSGAGPGCP
jgi:hypothetical protein